MTSVIPEPKALSNPYINRIKLAQGDIAQQKVDAVIMMAGDDGVLKGRINQAIQDAARQDIIDFVKVHAPLAKAGDVLLLPDLGLPCRHILYCVVPVWRTQFDRLDRFMVVPVRKAIEMAVSHQMKSIAVPPLASSGAHGFPKERAARLLLKAITERLDGSIDEIRITCLTPDMLEIFRKLLYPMGWTGE